MDDYFAGTRRSVPPPAYPPAPATAYPPAPAARPGPPTAYPPAPPTAFPPAPAKAFPPALPVAPASEPAWAVAPYRVGAQAPAPSPVASSWVPARGTSSSLLPKALAVVGLLVVVLAGYLVVPVLNDWRLARATHIALPSSLLGHERLEDHGAAAVFADAYASALEGEEVEVHAAAYGQIASPYALGRLPAVIVIAGEGHLSKGDREEFWQGAAIPAAQQAAGLTLQEVRPGRLGGEMRCVHTAAGGQGGLCLWADAGSFGVVILSDRTDAARMAVRVRESVERRT